VQGVEDPAAVVGERPQDFLERGVIRARRVVRERESDDREHLTGRRDGPPDERGPGLLDGAEQLRGERQRGAGAERDAEEVATTDHEGSGLGFTRATHADRQSLT
jgi:hypothetical protein